MALSDEQISAKEVSTVSLSETEFVEDTDSEDEVFDLSHSRKSLQGLQEGSEKLSRSLHDYLEWTGEWCGLKGWPEDQQYITLSNGDAEIEKEGPG